MLILLKDEKKYTYNFLNFSSDNSGDQIWQIVKCLQAFLNPIHQMTCLIQNDFTSQAFQSNSQNDFTEDAKFKVEEN